MTDANIELAAQGLPPPYILCGFDTFRQTLVTTLGDPKFVSHFDTSVALVADAPWGFAFKAFSQYKSRPAVIMTDNPCPEYWDDLWDLKPNVLLAGSYALADVVQALSCASRGERLRRTPYHQTPLTPAERAILHHCAMALKSKEIAEKLGISERTVQNALSSIYGKLGLRNRAGAILYYWGMGHLIPKLAALE